MEKLLNALGLCAKARKIVFGTPMICEALANPKTKPFLVISADDNSANTEKKLSDKCAYYEVKLVKIPVGGAEIAHAVGKTGKIAAVAVTDENLGKLVYGNLEKEHII